MTVTPADVVRQRYDQDLAQRIQRNAAEGAASRARKLRMVPQIEETLAKIAVAGRRRQWPEPFALVTVAHPQPPREVVVPVSPRGRFRSNVTEIACKKVDVLFEEVVGIPMVNQHYGSLVVCSRFYWVSYGLGSKLWLIDDSGRLLEQEAEYRDDGYSKFPHPSLKPVVFNDDMVNQWSESRFTDFLATLKRILRELK